MGRRPKPRGRLSRDECGPKQKKGASTAGRGSRGPSRRGSSRRHSNRDEDEAQPGATSSAETTVGSLAKKPTFSEWVEKEADRRELERQQLIRQREGRFEGPIVDVLEMQETDKRALLDLVAKGVMVVNPAAAASALAPPAKGKSEKVMADRESGEPESSAATDSQTADSIVSELSAVDAGAAAAAAEKIEAVVPDGQLKAYLTKQLLFDEARACRALQETGNAGLVPALDWLCLHTSDEELGHAFYGRAPLLTDTLLDELAARTDSISVRRFDFHIEMLLFNTTEELGASRGIVLSTLEAMLNHAMAFLKRKASESHASSLSDTRSWDSTPLRCPPQVPKRVLKWAVQMSVLRTLLPSESLDEVESFGHEDPDDAALAADPEMLDDELMALRSMYGEDKVLLQRFNPVFFASSDSSVEDARALLVAPQSPDAVRLGTQHWLLRRYSSVLVTVDLQLTISPKLSDFVKSIVERMAPETALAEADDAAAGAAADLAGEGDLSNQPLEHIFSRVVVEFALEEERYPLGALPVVYFSHPLLRRGGAHICHNIFKEAHTRIGECAGAPCLFAALSYITEVVTDCVQEQLDAELRIIEAKEAQEAKERKARKLKEKQRAAARQKPVHAPADPLKLQAEIEANRKKARAAKAKKEAAEASISRAAQKAKLKAQYQKRIARAAREGKLDAADAEADKHYKQYYGHLDQAAAKLEQEEAARKRKEHADRRQKELEAAEQAEQEALASKPLQADAHKVDTAPDGLDFVPNDFLQSLIDEVYFNDDDDDDSDTSEVGIKNIGSTSGPMADEARAAAKAALDESLQRRKAVLAKRARKSIELFEAEKRKFRSREYQAMLRQREGLPCYQRRDNILKLIQENEVIVLSGETGCGKTTQLPQMVLEDMMIRKEGARCNIICTQPRRISAIGVSERVADERCERVGQSVGYTIRLERKRSKDTRLLFCTTGVLLRRLQFNSNLDGVSHIFVDEVHERDLNSDMLLILLRDLLKLRARQQAENRRRREELRAAAGLSADANDIIDAGDKEGFKIILMSATINADKFSDYFGGCPTLNVPGRTFPVTPFFLEHILERTGHEIVEGSDYAKKKSALGGSRRNHPAPATSTRLGGNGGPNSQEATPAAAPPTRKELEIMYPDLSAATIQSLSIVDEEVINYDLLESLLEYIHEVEPMGAVLVFMPGMMEIMKLYNRLRDSPLFCNSSKFVVYPLHSALTTEDQKKVFLRPPSGVRKIVIATNIAETSITIDDCVCVVDSGRVKENRYDTEKNMATLLECWVAQASAKQRRGRAGRVQAGTAYHLMATHTWKGLDEYTLPEMLRVPLDETILQLKMLNVTDVRGFFRRALDPPSHAALDQALTSLTGLQALEGVQLFHGEDAGAFGQERNATESLLDSMDRDIAMDGHLTPLGFHLAALAVSPRIGKMLIFGAILRCLGPILTVAATLSYRSPFAAPFDKRDEAAACKQSFTKGYDSDLFCVIHAYDGWCDAIRNRREKQFLRSNFLSRATLVMIRSMRQQFLDDLRKIGFVPTRATKASERGQQHSSAGRNKSVRDHRDPDNLGRFNEQAKNGGLVTAVLVAGLYPNILLASDTVFDRFGNPELTTIDEHEVKIHPSSVNFKAAEMGRKLARLMIFHEKVRTTQVYIRDCTPVSPYPVLLFGGTLDVYHRQGVVVLGNWIGFRVAPKVAVLTKTLRLMLEQLLKNKIRDPKLDLSGGASQTVLNAISMLMARSAGKPEKQPSGSKEALAHASSTHELLNAMSEADRKQQKLMNSSARDSAVSIEDRNNQNGSQDGDRPLGPQAAWECHVCTFVNLPRLHGERSHCKMCESQRAKPSRDQALQWKHKYDESTKLLTEAEEAAAAAQRKADGRAKSGIKRFGFYNDLKPPSASNGEVAFVAESRTDDDGYRLDIGTGTRYGISFKSELESSSDSTNIAAAGSGSGGERHSSSRGRGRGRGRGRARGRGRGRTHGRGRSRLDAPVAHRMVRHALSGRKKEQ